MTAYKNVPTVKNDPNYGDDIVLVHDAIVFIFGVTMYVKSVDDYNGDNVLISLDNNMQAIVKRDDIRIG